MGTRYNLKARQYLPHEAQLVTKAPDESNLQTNSKVDTAVEETAMVTDLREICEQFSDDHIKVKIDICATNFPNKIKVEI